MIELPLEYWNKLADQMIFISALMGGFSIAVIATLISNSDTSRIQRIVFRIASLATVFFLVTIFAMTKILMMTTEGFPFEVSMEELMLPRLIGGLAFFLGILSLLGIVSLSGWTKSKRMGRFTTLLGIVSSFLIIMMLV